MLIQIPQNLNLFYNDLPVNLGTLWALFVIMAGIYKINISSKFQKTTSGNKGHPPPPDEIRINKDIKTWQY